MATRHALRSIASSRLAVPVALTAISSGINSAWCEADEPGNAPSLVLPACRAQSLSETCAADLAERLTKETGPFAGAVTFGGISGYCSGYAVAVWRRVGGRLLTSSGQLHS